MNELNVQRYIKLTTKAKLANDKIKQWFKTVKDNAPSGTLYGVQAVTAQGHPKAVSMIHRVGEHGHEFIIPLTRDLSESETETIVHAWDAYCPTGDMDIEISAAQADRLEHQAPPVRVPNDKYLGLCLQLAKTHHTDWMRDRSDQGWHYGTTVSLKNKTHPLMRPWDELPAQYRKIDHDTPERVLTLLNDQGYAVIKKEELDGLLKLLRGAM